ncbi:alanine racemase [Sporosarcina highlanderae]|uniref:Alanine racemase n=1 Tax=Sporosarcina highlanderae TaxID=3035916 RepID=A0ABT8JNE0_9BACL|nr:alanine racemase [Sporosarcina highlanderae]MDN4606328.1 alanine racemase [Sporosarcina highlanderae]
MENYRPTKAIIDLQAIRDNIKSLKQYLPSRTSVIAVVKADGYGHGAFEVAKTAINAGAMMLAVATLEEAVDLRNRGITADILVMGPSPVEVADKAAVLGIHITVSDTEWLREAILKIGSGFSLKVHVKIDSGMGRIGLRDEKSLNDLVDVIKGTTAIRLEGAFTHFACADEEDSKKTEVQFNRFMDLVDAFPERPKHIHASNSAAALLYPDYALDAVRFGIGMYGIPPSRYVETRLPFDLKRSFTLETELAYVKFLEKGSGVSYGGAYETEQSEWIGTLPIGYADGLKRGLRNQEVLIAGERMPIVGTICMDQCMVKLPCEMPVGEKVTLIGRQGNEEIKMEEWADRLGTIPYEIAVTIARRVPRIY